MGDIVDFKSGNKSSDSDEPKELIYNIKTPNELMLVASKTFEQACKDGNARFCAITYWDQEHKCMATIHVLDDPKSAELMGDNFVDYGPNLLLAGLELAKTDIIDTWKETRHQEDIE